MQEEDTYRGNVCVARAQILGALLGLVRAEHWSASAAMAAQDASASPATGGLVLRAHVEHLRVLLRLRLRELLRLSRSCGALRLRVGRRSSSSGGGGRDAAQIAHDGVRVAADQRAEAEVAVANAKQVSARDAIGERIRTSQATRSPRVRLELRPLHTNTGLQMYWIVFD